LETASPAPFDRGQNTGWSYAKLQPVVISHRLQADLQRLANMLK